MWLGHSLRAEVLSFEKLCFWGRNVTPNDRLGLIDLSFALKLFVACYLSGAFLDGALGFIS
jgi:hypothetical protein